MKIIILIYILTYAILSFNNVENYVLFYAIFIKTKKNDKK